MNPRLFNRHRWLVLPFLVFFFFPVGTAIFAGMFDPSLDWNKGLVGLRAGDSTPSIEWSLKAWWAGDFQKSFSAWWENRCPIRSFFLRLFNQVDYSCLRSSYMLQNGLLIGPQGELDAESYVLDAAHQVPLAPDHIAKLMGKLEGLQAQLARQGKLLLVLTTPDKAATYPETLPARFRSYDRPGTRTYDDLMKALGASKIPYLDGAKIVHELALAKPAYPLFPRGSVHWDSYAAAQLLPALSEKVAQLTGRPLPVPTIAGVEMVPARFARNLADHDMASLLNLLSRPYGYQTPQLSLNYPPPSSPPPARVVVAGGSFTWNILELLTGPPAIEQHLHAPFAYYGGTFFDSAINWPISRRTYEDALSASDLLVLEINELVPETTLDALPPIIQEADAASPQPAWRISFLEGGNSEDFTSAGFSRQEPGFRWTDGTDVALVIPLPPQEQLYTMTARVRPFVSARRPGQRVEIFADGAACGGNVLKGEEISTITAHFSAAGMVRIYFHLPDAVSPTELKLGDDARRLGLAFYTVDVTPAGQPR